LKKVLVSKLLKIRIVGQIFSAISSKYRNGNNKWQMAKISWIETLYAEKKSRKLLRVP